VSRRRVPTLGVRDLAPAPDPDPSSIRINVTPTVPPAVRRVVGDWRTFATASQRPFHGIATGQAFAAALASEAISRELVADSDVRGRSQTERVWRVTGATEAVTATTTPTSAHAGERPSRRAAKSSARTTMAEVQARPTRAPLQPR